MEPETTALIIETLLYLMDTLRSLELDASPETYMSDEYHRIYAQLEGLKKTMREQSQ